MSTNPFEPVLLSLPSLTPSLAFEILPHGLTFHRFIVQAGGKTHDVLVSPEEPKGHLTTKYTNTAVGRYANRLPVGPVEIEKEGHKATVNILANENERVSLHGGPVGFDYVPWTQVKDLTTSELFSPDELKALPADAPNSSALFKLVSADGDQGYPGTLTVEALVTLVPPVGETKAPSREDGKKDEYLGSLIYVFRASVDKDVTPINLTSHWGFNLDASLQQGPETDSIKNHNLFMKADRIVERDADSLHTGGYIPTETSPSHNHNGKKLGEGFPSGPGYDDFYVFKSRVLAAPRKVLKSQLKDVNLLQQLLVPARNYAVSEKPLVELKSEKSGIALQFDSNQSGVMLYSNGFADAAKGSRKKIHGGSGIKDHGDSYEPGSAAFLEFHEPLAAFLDATKKNSDDDTLLTKDELYHNYVRCDVWFREP